MMGARGGVRLVLLLAAFHLSFGCAARPFARGWGQGADIVGFDIASGPETGADFTILLPLSKIFYERINNRRFNSKATFDDPALREYFHTGEAFADYYANFAEALARLDFESRSPTSVRLLEIRRRARNRVSIRVRYVGENAKPLCWWSTRVEREDLWEFVSGRWWILPGKV